MRHSADVFRDNLIFYGGKVQVSLKSTYINDKILVLNLSNRKVVEASFCSVSLYFWKQNYI
jgi:hypothetical protein